MYIPRWTGNELSFAYPCPGTFVQRLDCIGPRYLLILFVHVVCSQVPVVRYRIQIPNFFTLGGRFWWIWQYVNGTLRKSSPEGLHTTLRLTISPFAS